jgi:hypothetical protein
MTNPLTLTKAQNELYELPELYEIFERYNGLVKTSLLICGDTPIIKHSIETQIAFDKKRYETAFETSVNLFMEDHGFNRAYAESYIMTCLKKHTTFNECDKNVSNGFANFLDKNKNNINN